MRQKVLDYLDKPSKKVYEQLTTMERKFVDRQKDDGKPAAKPKEK